MSRTTIIAEMAWAHDGSMDKALRIMRAAKSAGADAIGVHVTNLEGYMVPHYGSGAGRVSAGKEHMQVYRYLEGINPSQEDWVRFSDAAREEGMALCVMPNDLPSLVFCESRIDPQMYVLSSAAFVESEFITALAACNRKTLFRIGGATLGEIDMALNLFRTSGQGEAVLLHGFQNYPTQLDETNIRQLAVLHELFGVPVGLADHIDGSEAIAKVIPILALGFGATYLEKHITWDREEKGEDFEAALNPSDFAEFVGNVRAAEIALGVRSWLPLSPAAERYRGVSRKRVVATQNLSAGTVLARTDLCFKRADEGLSPDRLGMLLGRTLKHPLRENDGVTLEDLL